jgi:hypothetical protein
VEISGVLIILCMKKMLQQQICKTHFYYDDKANNPAILSWLVI